MQIKIKDHLSPAEAEIWTELGSSLGAKILTIGVFFRNIRLSRLRLTTLVDRLVWEGGFSVTSQTSLGIGIFTNATK